MSGCSSETVTVDSDGTFDLVADPETGVIYIKNYTRDSYTVYTPYFSENGKLCKYDDHKIVEIEEEDE
jgi:hypothetical protein